MTTINHGQEREAASCLPLSTRAQLSTATEPSGWSRRGFMGVLAAATGGALAAGMLAAPTAHAAAPVHPSRPVKGVKRDKKGGVSATPAGYQPKAPFALSSRSVLSEDYFEVVNHKIDTDKGDKVVAYTRTNGDTEAVVLQDEVVKLVYRDVTQAGGWAVYPLPGAAGVADMVAAVGKPTSTAAPYLQICYVKKDSPDTLIVATQPAVPVSAGGPLFSTSNVTWNVHAGPLAITMGTSNELRNNLEPLVSAMVASSGAGVSDAQVCWHFGSKESGVLTGFSFSTWDGDRSWSVAVAADAYTDQFNGGLVLTVAKADGSLELWSQTGLDGATVGRMNLPSPRPPQDGSRFRTVVSDIVTLIGLQPTNRTALPAALVWTQHQVPVDDGALVGDPQLWSVTLNGNVAHPDWVWTNLAVPTNQNGQFDIPVTTALTPRASTSSGYLLDVFVSWDGTLRVVRQIEQGGTADAYHPMFTPLIPLQPDVRTISSQASPSAGNELILVSGDGTLHTLEKDAVSGAWTDAVMHLPASELQQDSSYRVTLTLADTAWNAPVGNHDITITASTPAVAMLEGPNQKTVLLGDTPVTATTDANGEVLLALLAEGLSAPTLTITSAGLPTPATVYPSEPVNTYMQGGGTLNFLPVMSGATLAGAKTPDGQTVAPGATDPAAASDAATKMKQAADLGAQGAQLGSLSSTVGRIDGGRAAPPEHRHHRHCGHHKHHHPGGGVSVELLGSNIDNWAHDVVHAIKKGAVAVATVTVDVATKIATIVVEAAGWVDNAVQILVHTIEDAAHVLHSELRKIGADIVAAVKWLRALVASLLQDSAKVAKEFSALIGQATDFVGDDVDNLKATVDTWITGKEKNIQDLFDRLRTGYPKNATLATIADFNPAKPVGASRFGRKPRPTPPIVLNDDDTPQPHGDWFLNKVKHAIYGQLDTPEFTGISFDKRELDVLNACAPHIDELHTAADGLWTFIKDAVADPSQFGSVVVPALLEQVSKLIQAALNLLKAALDAVFDMMAALAKAVPGMLGTPIGNAGIVGKLLSLAGLGDFHIGTVAMMVFAFPATLAYKIANGPDTRPFDYLTGAQGRLGADPGADRALQITAASVMGVWSGLDVVDTVLDAAGKGVPLLTPAVDLAGPLLVGALAPPFVKDGLPDWHQSTSSDHDSEAVGSWIFDLLPAFGSAQVLYAKKSVAVDAAATENSMLWIQTMCGVLSLVAGVLAASNDPDAKGKDYAVPILLNIPNILASGNTKNVEEATDGLSVVVAAGLGLFAGVAGAALYGSN